MFLVFLYHFDMLMSKIIFKKLKNIIDMYFSTKSYLKSNRNHTAKQILIGLHFEFFCLELFFYVFVLFCYTDVQNIFFKINYFNIF